MRCCSMDEVGHYVLQDKAQLELHTSTACPEGYVVGELRLLQFSLLLMVTQIQ